MDIGEIEKVSTIELPAREAPAVQPAREPIRRKEPSKTPTKTPEKVPDKAARTERAVA